MQSVILLSEHSAKYYSARWYSAECHSLQSRSLMDDILIIFLKKSFKFFRYF
jgi:hypothetical protein